MTAWDQLAQNLPDEQRQQLADLLLRRLDDGWGILEIEIKDHHVKEFREIIRTPARKPAQVTNITCVS